MYNWSQMYLMNLAKGGKYQNLKPAITINILRYKIFVDESAHSMYSIYNMENKHRLNEDMEIHFLEVSKFHKKPVCQMSRVERWLAYFSNKLNQQELEELAMSEAAIQNAIDATDVFMQDKSERLKYLNREMAILDYESDKAYWMEEGEKRARQKVVSDIVISMLNNGQSPAEIAKSTNIPESDITRIAEANGIETK